MPFGSLWIPVLVSAAAVFLGSSILHMVLKYHSADMKGLPNEDAMREALGKQKPGPGQYFVPYCAGHKQMSEPAMKEKFEKGPVAMITVFPNGAVAMGRVLSQWLGFILLVSFVASYVARLTLSAGADGMLVLRVTGTVAFAGYALGNISDSIWKGQPWGNTARALMDAMIYSVLTGLTFKLLWP